MKIKQNKIEAKQERNRDKIETKQKQNKNRNKK